MIDTVPADDPVTVTEQMPDVRVQEDEEEIEPPFVLVWLHATVPLGLDPVTEAVHVALREIVALKRFKNLMRKYSAKLTFEGLDE